MANKVFIYFDYIYYRLAKLYFKTDGKDSLAPTALLTLIQLFICIDIIALINLELLLKAFNKTTLGVTKFLYIIIAILLLIYNIRRYKDKFNSFDEKWNGETKGVKVTKGLMILLLIISVLALAGILLNLRRS